MTRKCNIRNKVANAIVRHSEKDSQKANYIFKKRPLMFPGYGSNRDKEIITRVTKLNNSTPIYKTGVVYIIETDHGTVRRVLPEQILGANTIPTIGAILKEVSGYFKIVNSK